MPLRSPEAHGLHEADVQKMLAAFWQQSDHASPVEQRVHVLKRFWNEFDALHTRQAPGMPSLWGLVQDHAYVHPRVEGVGGRQRDDAADDSDGDAVYAPRLYEQLLPAELNADIVRLWGTTMLPRWPDRLVTEPAPHARLAEAFGPALRFWEGAALTCWFLCEGPYSRTDIDGLPNYHQPQLSALDEAGCPIGGELFRDLREAEERFGKPKHGDGGLTITITISLFGEDDDGERDDEPHVRFEQLRDIVTRHRRAWAERYLDTYLRARWELELRAAAQDYHRRAAAKSKPPTLKQFAKIAAPETNQWFGGDITGAYAALGLKTPDRPRRAKPLVPRDPDGFATRLYERLRGEPYRHPPSWKEDNDERARHNEFTSLASLCVEYLQLQEALGERPELKTFGRSKFQYRSSVLSEDVDEAWRIYAEAVQAVVDEPMTSTATSAPTKPTVGATAQRTHTPAADAGSAPDAAGQSRPSVAPPPPSRPSVVSPPPQPRRGLLRRLRGKR